jgi:hypothetical protein
MKHEIANEQIEQVRNSFQKALNRHGYGFQFGVLKIAEELAKKVDEDERSKWTFLFSEVPVQVQGFGTRIDFVLSRHRSLSSSPFLHLVCECKRANPALSNWCFIRAPRTRRNQSNGADPLMLETIIQNSGVQLFKIIATKDTLVKDAYHFGVEVRAARQGDDKGESGKAIEDAVTQVLRGLNGYLEMLAQHTQLVEGTITYLLPVVFTTAQLWVSKADLGLAELATGDLDLSDDEFESVPWLWYQYHMSPGLKHSSISQPKDQIKIEEFIESNYIRTIAIVSASGMEEFLLHTSADFF